MTKKHGFTLIELLTVVLILGILTAIALPQYRKSIQRAEAASALINVKTIFDASKRYYSAHSRWPTSFTGLDVEFLDAAATGEIGEFQYSFSAANKSVSACRLSATSTSTYCLSAYYKIGSTRDVYTCKYNDEKYRALCESLQGPNHTSTDEGIWIE